MLTRLVGTACGRLGPEAVEFHDHRRAAKRRALEIGSKIGAGQRTRRCREMLRLTDRTVCYAVAAVRVPWAAKWTAAMDEALTVKVVDQTRRRVLDGEKVLASEKIVSLFEPHTDIVVKGGRGTEHGHKVNLTTGRSGLVLDAVVEDGNPVDNSPRARPMLERVAERYGAAPDKETAFDGGYALKKNLKDAKAMVGNKISDVSALSRLTSLLRLHLDDNAISDIPSFCRLRNLSVLRLGRNAVVDISPLLDSRLVGTGDYMDLRGNPLGEGQAIHIQALRESGATIMFDDGGHRVPHDLAPEAYQGYARSVVPTFNLGSNRRQVSRLRLTNPTDRDRWASFSTWDDASLPWGPEASSYRHVGRWT